MNAASSSRCSAARRLLAARGAGAAERAHAAHRRAHELGRRRSEGQARIAAFLQGHAAIGLDDRPQRADRHSLGRGRCRPHSQIRGRIGRARAGRHLGLAGVAAVAPLQEATRTVPIVFAAVSDPVGGRLRRELGAAGRQRHRIYRLRIRHERQMAGAAQRDRAARDASGGPSRSRHSRRNRRSSPRSRPWRRRSGWS